MPRQSPPFTQFLVADMTNIILRTTGVFLLQMEFVSVLVITLVFTFALFTLKHFPLHVTSLHVFHQIVLVLCFVVTVTVLTGELSFLPGQRFRER
jgi:hypothetical protein